MATIEDITNLVYRELSYASGRGVQVHAQDRVGNKINQMYRALARKFYWDDYFINDVGTLVGDGSISLDLSSKLYSTMDIHSIFYEDESRPLPWAPRQTNILRVRTRCLYGAKKGLNVFTVLPLDLTGTISINYRSVSPNDYDIDEDVPFYKDLLVLGTAYAIASSDAINDQYAQTLLNQFNQLLTEMSNSQIKSVYGSSLTQSNPITEWTEL